MRIKGTAWVQQRPASEVYELLWDTGNRLLDNAEHLGDTAAYAAEYLGRLFDYVDQAAVVGRHNGEEAIVNIGAAHFHCRSEQNAIYGDATLPELASELRDGEAGAIDSYLGIAVVDGQIMHAVYDRYNIPESPDPTH